eukprot:Sdes_comp19348_c0_seq1m10576
MEENFICETKKRGKKQKTKSASKICESFFENDAKNSTKSSAHELWVEKYSPLNLSELCVHAKKISEIRTALNESFDKFSASLSTSFPKIFLLSGPSGSCKSALVKVLSREDGFEILEWINPVHESEWKQKGDKSEAKFFMRSESLFEKFTKFLFQSEKYESIFSQAAFSGKNYQRKVILVEDFPQIYGGKFSFVER